MHSCLSDGFCLTNRIACIWTCSFRAVEESRSVGPAGRWRNGDRFVDNRPPFHDNLPDGRLEFDDRDERQQDCSALGHSRSNTTEHRDSYQQRGGSSALELSKSSDGGNDSLYLRQGSSAFKPPRSSGGGNQSSYQRQGSSAFEPPRSSGGGNQSSSYQRQDSSASSQQLWNERDFLFRQPAESSYQHTRHGSAMQISTDVPDNYEYWGKVRIGGQL